MKIKILIKGYVREKNDYELASSTVTFIRENNINILVDTGMNRKLLLNALKKEKLSPKDINYVVLTHTHLDHCLLVGLFVNAAILDDSNIYFFNGKNTEHQGIIPKTNIKIIPTPGHDDSHCSVEINSNKFGKIVIASDVFWWPDNKKQKTDKNSLLKLSDPYANDKKTLKKSREKILKIADYIIPGHGKPFKLEK